MGSLGCPLCCNQVFATVSALHEHLVYYMYRPLLCVMCRITTSGIHDLMHHLGHHIADNVPPAGSTARPSKKVLTDETKIPAVAASVSFKSSSSASCKGAAEFAFPSTAADAPQLHMTDKQRPGSYKKREEPAELSLHAYFCNICGDKVVGKDRYFMHIKEHNSSLDKPLSSASQACSDQLSPLLLPFHARGDDTNFSSSHESAHTPTPSDSTSLKRPLTSDSDTAFVKTSTSISDYMDDLGSSNQLLKLREWQFEKLGKHYETRRGRILNLQGESNVGSILSQSSCSPSVSELGVQVSHCSTAPFLSPPENSQAEMMDNNSPSDSSVISTQSRPLCTPADVPASTSTNSPVVLPDVPALAPRTTSSDPFNVSVSPLFSSAIPISSSYASQSVTQHTKGFHTPSNALPCILPSSSNSSNIISSSFSYSGSHPCCVANTYTNITTPLTSQTASHHLTTVTSQSASPSFTSIGQSLSPPTLHTSSSSSHSTHHHPPGNFCYPPSTTQSHPPVSKSLISPHDPSLTPRTQSLRSSLLQPTASTTTQGTPLLALPTYQSPSPQLENLFHADDSQPLQFSGNSPTIASAAQAFIPPITQSYTLPTTQSFIPVTHVFTPVTQPLIPTSTTMSSTPSTTQSFTSPINQSFASPITQPFTPPDTQPFTLQATQPPTSVSKSLTPTNAQSCKPPRSLQALTSELFTSPSSSELFTSPSSQPFTPPTTQPFTPPNTKTLTPPVTQPFTPPTIQPKFTPPTTQPFTPPYTQTFTPPTTHPFTPPNTQPFTPPTTQPFTPPNTQPFTPPTTQPFTPPNTQPFIPSTTQPFTPPITEPFTAPTTQSFTPSNRQPFTPPSTQPFTPPNTKPFIPPNAQSSTMIVTKIITSTAQPFTTNAQLFTSPGAKKITSPSDHSLISPSNQIFSHTTGQALTPSTQPFQSTAEGFIPPNTHSLTVSSSHPNNTLVTQSFTPPLIQPNFLSVNKPSTVAVIELLNSTTQSFSLPASQPFTPSSQIVPSGTQPLRPATELLGANDSTLTHPLEMQPCIPPTTQQITVSTNQTLIPPVTQPQSSTQSSQPFTCAKEGAQDTLCSPVSTSMVPIHQAVKSSGILHKQDPSYLHSMVFTTSNALSVTATVPSHISSVIHAKPHTYFTHNLDNMRGNESTSNIKFLQQDIHNTSKKADITSTVTLATYSVTESTTSLTYTSNTAQLQVKTVHMNPLQENSQNSVTNVSQTPLVSSSVSATLLSEIQSQPIITENNVKSTHSLIVHDKPGHSMLPSSSITNLLTLTVASSEETGEHFSSSHLLENHDTIVKTNTSGALQPQGAKTMTDVMNTTPTYHNLKPAEVHSNDTSVTEYKSSTGDSTSGDGIGSLLNEEKPNALLENQGTKPYLHKKFHHEQGRRMMENTVNLAPKGDVNLYINSFQSMLVNKLNKVMGADFAADTEDDCQSLRSDNESVLNIPPVIQTPEFICSVCKAKFRMRKDYIIHQRKHISEAQVTHKCQHCGKVFNKKRSKDIHEKKHMHSKTHRCPKCSKIFIKVNSFHRHLVEVHATKKIYLCSKCNKSFSTLRLLKNHVGVHRVEKTYKCKYCSHSCLTASGLRSHLHDIHSNKASQVFKCSVCNETFKKRYGLQRHIKRRHSKEKIVCQECDKVFSCQEDLARHKQSHSLQQCQECGKGFSSTWTLQRHAATHNPKESFQCKQCKATFTRKDSLATHMKIHTQQKEYKCHCGKCFVKKSQLTAHQDKHSEIPKYACSVCHHRFKFKISLKNHSCKPVTDK